MPLDANFEHLIENDIALSVRYGNRSKGDLWRAVFLAHRVVHKYKVPAMDKLAVAHRRDRSQIENWLFAYDLFATYYSRNKTDALKARRVLTLTHFIVAAECQRKYNMEQRRVEKYLRDFVEYAIENDAQDYRKYPESASALRRDIEAEYGKSGKGASFEWYAKRTSWIDGVQVSEGCPPEIREWARVGANLFEKHKGNGGARLDSKPSAMTKKKGWRFE